MTDTATPKRHAGHRCCGAECEDKHPPTGNGRCMDEHTVVAIRLGPAAPSHRVRSAIANSRRVRRNRHAASACLLLRVGKVGLGVVHGVENRAYEVRPLRSPLRKARVIPAVASPHANEATRAHARHWEVAVRGQRVTAYSNIRRSRSAYARCSNFAAHPPRR
jgi:hypothetical protein